MRVNFKLLRITLAMIFLLVVAMTVTSQSETSSKTDLLLEVVHSYCSGDCDSQITRIYADGRYTAEGVLQEKAKSGRLRKVSFKWEKQLEADEITELVALAEQPDFLSARPEYSVKTVVDYPDWFIINYRNKGREKTVKVINFSRGNEAEKGKVPTSVLKLATWAKPFSFNR